MSSDERMLSDQNARKLLSLIDQGELSILAYPLVYHCLAMWSEQTIEQIAALLSSPDNSRTFYLPINEYLDAYDEAMSVLRKYSQYFGIRFY